MVICVNVFADTLAIRIYSILDVFQSELESNVMLISPCPSGSSNGYRVFPWGKVRPGRAADHSSPSSAAVMEE